MTTQHVAHANPQHLLHSPLTLCIVHHLLPSCSSSSSCRRTSQRCTLSFQLTPVSVLAILALFDLLPLLLPAGAAAAAAAATMAASPDEGEPFASGLMSDLNSSTPDDEL